MQEHTVLLDIGCGTGVFLALTKQQYPKSKCVGMDPDPKALAIAQRRIERARLDVELQQAFAEELPLNNASIDVCFCILTLHHMPDDIKQKAIVEMFRVLKPQGKAVIADFGATRSAVFRKILSLENVEYIKANLDGLIPVYLEQAGFRTPTVVGTHFPRIQVLIAEKS